MDKMITVKEKNTTFAKLPTDEVRIRHSAAVDYFSLKTYLEYLDAIHDCVNLSYIGSSVMGNGIPLVTLGKNTDVGGTFYIGGMDPRDCISPPSLLRFICDYADFLTSGRRMYGMSMPFLWENRTIRVVPMLNPDGYIIRREGRHKNTRLNDKSDRNDRIEEYQALLGDRIKKINERDGYAKGDCSHWKYNALGIEINRSFLPSHSPDSGSDASAEKSPESSALQNYLRLYSDTLENVLDLDSCDNGIRYFSQKDILPRAKTVARLLSRMSGYQLLKMDISGAESSENDGSLCSYVIDSLRKSAYHCGCLDDGITPDDPEEYIKVYAAMREPFFSCPLL